jgi:agarase
MTEASRTRWGGIVAERVRASGYFRVEQMEGVWWFVDPDGGLFLSKGIDAVNFDHDCIQNTDRFPYREVCQQKYGSREAWRAAAAERLRTWGFNSLGAWSDYKVASAGSAPLAVTGIVDIAASFCSQQQAAWPSGDAFHPDFEIFARKRASDICGPHRSDAGFIGWFTDNELRWAPDWRGRDEPLTVFLNEKVASPGRKAAINMLRNRYGNFREFKSIWQVAADSWRELAMMRVTKPPFIRQRLKGEDVEVDRLTTDARRARFFADCDAFAGALADRYFQVTVAAIKEADPNHLVLGCRFAYVPQQSVIKAAGRYLDVVSFNCYEYDATPSIKAYVRSGRPCLIGEFSFRGDDSGLPNTIGAGPRVASQAQRARSFDRYVSIGLKHPTLIGYHWFLHADQPTEGRFDGENSNYGVVTIDDVVYDELTRAMAGVNEQAEEVHRRGAKY